MSNGNNVKDFKAVLILCEGKTDVAFVRRILISENYRDYKKKINEFASPINGYFSKKLKEYDYDSGTVFDRPIVPTILRRAHGNSVSFALIYSIEGDNVGNYNEIIRDYKLLLSANDDTNPYEKELIGNIVMSLVFILDADDKTVNDKVNYLKDNFTDHIPELQYLRADRLDVDTTSFKQVSLHILSDSDSGQGNLENIILEMMLPEAENMLDEAGYFLEKFNFSRSSENKKLSDFNKSKLGIVGQIENSGIDNASIIKLTKLFNEKIKTHPKCLEILGVISKSRQSLN
jgi:hypothetical protein